MDKDMRTLYCGNLSNRLTEEVLYELFLQAGPLEEVKIPKDRDNRPRSYGFITYKHDESVDYAIKLFKGTALYNRELTVDRKVRIPEQPSVNHYEMLAPMINASVANMSRSLAAHGMNNFPNPYGGHSMLGYQGPVNMYPSVDRRNQPRKHPYYRN